MKRPWLMLVIVTLLACIGMLVFQFIAPTRLVVSKETTVITSPLSADGTPDYGAYLHDRAKQGVTPQNNGAIPLLQATWPAGLDPAEQPLVCREMGMAVPSRKGLVEPQYDKELWRGVHDWLDAIEENGSTDGREWDYELVFDTAAEAPWRRGDVPLLAEWIDAHALEYDLLDECARRPEFYSPSGSRLRFPDETLWNSSYWTGIASNVARRALLTRAMMRLGERDAAGAWRDIHALYDIAGHPLGQFIVFESIAIHTEWQADRATMLILEDPSCDMATANAILAFQRQRPPRLRIADILDHGERLLFASTVVALRDQGFKNLYGFFHREVGVVEQGAVDPNLILRKGNHWYDQGVGALQIGDVRQRTMAISKLEQDFDMLDVLPAGGETRALFDRRARNEVVSNKVVSLLYPSIRHCAELQDQGDVRRALLITAAALGVYRRDQGNYPESLDLLVPDLLDAIPVDPVTGGTFTYKRFDQGYLLYTHGLDGVDDGGSNHRLKVYLGYEISEANEPLVRQVLDLPQTSPEVDGDSEEAPLIHQIPEAADDHAIRLPLPKLKLPGFPPPRE